MPSAATPPPAPRPTVPATFNVGLLQPVAGPSYPKASPIGMLVIALAYFSLGVAVGGLMRRSDRARRWLPVLIVPGLVAAIVFIAWVIRSLV